ncbi:UNVERIFIED_CONTAM: hypothetical protein K2H54_057426 [Gekko kuhli]
MTSRQIGVEEGNVLSTLTMVRCPWPHAFSTEEMATAGTEEMATAGAEMLTLGDQQKSDAAEMGKIAIRTCVFPPLFFSFLAGGSMPVLGL